MVQTKTEQTSKIEHRGEGNFLAQLELSTPKDYRLGTEMVIDFEVDWEERGEIDKDIEIDNKLEKGRTELKSAGKKHKLLFFLVESAVF